MTDATHAETQASDTSVDRARRPAEIAVVGSANVDLLVHVDAFVQPGETILAGATTSLPGGKGSNQALAAAKLGRRVAFVGRVGDDDQARLMRAAWRAAGVDDSAVRTDEAATGQALCFFDPTGESAIVVVPGANAHLSAEDVRTAPAVETAAVVVAQLEIDPATVLAAARASSGTFVLNAAPARPLDPALLGAVDVLIVNESEFSTITGLDPAAAGLRADLATAGLPPDVVITLGPAGARVWHDGELADVPAYSVDAVDTTGAGDVFVGACAAALAAGDDIVSAARWAVVAAGLSTRAAGATAAQPSADEVSEAIADRRAEP